MGLFNLFVDKKIDIANAILYALKREYQTYSFIITQLEKGLIKSFHEIESLKTLIYNNRQHIIVKNVHLNDVFKIAEYKGLYYVEQAFDEKFYIAKTFYEIDLCPKLKLSYTIGEDVIVDLELVDFETFLDDLYDIEAHEIYKMNLHYDYISGIDIMHEHDGDFIITDFKEIRTNLEESAKSYVEGINEMIQKKYIY